MLSELLKKREKYVVALFVELGDWKLQPGKTENKFQNVDTESAGITKKMVDEYRGLWPQGNKGSVPHIEKNLLRLMLEGYDFKTIKATTKVWIDKEDPKYIGQAHYFLYKLVDGAWRSRFKETLEYTLALNDDVPDDFAG